MYAISQTSPALRLVNITPSAIQNAHQNSSPAEGVWLYLWQVVYVPARPVRRGPRASQSSDKLLLAGEYRVSAPRKVLHHLLLCEVTLMRKTWGTKARGAGCAGHLPASLLVHLQPLASAPLCLPSWVGGRRASEVQFGTGRAWQLLLGAAGDALCPLPGAWPGFASRRKEVWGAAGLGGARQPPGTALSSHTSCSKVAQPFLQPLEGSLQRQQQRNQRSGPSEGSKKASIPPHIQCRWGKQHKPKVSALLLNPAFSFLSPSVGFALSNFVFPSEDEPKLRTWWCSGSIVAE